MLGHVLRENSSDLHSLFQVGFVEGVRARDSPRKKRMDDILDWVGVTSIAMQRQWLRTGSGGDFTATLRIDDSS